MSLENYLSGFDYFVLVDSKFLIFLKKFSNVVVDSKKLEPNLIEFPLGFKLFGLIKDDEAQAMQFKN